MMKSHQDKYLYICEVCDKGFTQREGFNNHKLVHAPDSERIQCTHEDCDVTFNSTRNLKAHLKTQHGVKRYIAHTATNHTVLEAYSLNTSKDVRRTQVELLCIVIFAQRVHQEDFTWRKE